MDGWIVRLAEAVPRTQSQDVPQMLQGHLLPPSAMVPSLCHPIWAGAVLTSEFLKVKSLSRVRLFAAPWTVAHQASPSMGFSRQEYWSGLPFPSPGDLPHPGIEPRSPVLQADTLPSEPPWSLFSATPPGLGLCSRLSS